VRIIAATNKDLEVLVKEGTFRKDFFYRINVAKLTLPPLRVRKEDIPLLSEHFIHKFNRLQGKGIEGFQPEALALLMSYNYPGNIRELENIIEYSIVVCKNSLIGVEHLPDYMVRLLDNEEHEAHLSKQKKSSIKRLEKDFIYNALAQNNWNRKLTASRLGMHPATLWRKIKSLHIKLPSQDGRNK
jgi:transcriptional regulator with PAS, ATPase and Fis domain